VRRVTSKSGVIAVSLYISVFTLVWVRVRRQSGLALDPYWRFKGRVVAEQIVAKHSVVPEQELIDSLTYFSVTAWVNIIVPMLVSELHYITGLDIGTISTLPVLVLPYLLAHGCLTHILFNRRSAFAVGLVASLSAVHPLLHLLDSPHRVLYSWTMFFFIIVFLVRTYGEKNALSTSAFIIFSVAFLTSYNTWAVASIVFFSALVFSEHRFGDSVVSLSQYSLFVVLVISYFVLFYKWLIFVFELLFGLIFLGDVPSMFANPLSVLKSRELSGPITDVFLSQSPSTLYRLVSISHLSTLIIAALGLFLHRLYHHRESIRRVAPVTNWTILDSIVFAILVQAGADIVFRPLFLQSGGVNPLLLGLFFSPVFVAGILFRAMPTVRDYRSGNISATRVTLVVIVTVGLLSGIGASVLAPTTPEYELGSVSPSETAQIRWIADFSKDDKIVGDFNIVSGYYTVGGRGEVYLPLSRRSEYTSPEAQWTYLRIYYEDPASAGPINGVTMYSTSNRMSRVGIYNTASKPTQPTNVGSSLDKARDWDKIFTSHMNTSTYRYD